jgi:hypothetical protein
MLSFLQYLLFVAGVGMTIKFSAGKASRKWGCGGSASDETVMVIAAALLLAVGLQAEVLAAPQRHGASSQERAGNAQAGPSRPIRGRGVAAPFVPLPKPRPAEASAKGTEQATKPNPTYQEGEKTGEQAAPAPPAPSACRQALTDEIAIAPSIPDIHGPGACGGEDLVRLEAVVLPDKGRVSLKPAAILRCTMASAIADWLRTDMTALAGSLGTVVSELDNFDSFECRGRNRVAGAHLSEHARANALDVRSLKLANGQSIALTDRTVPRELRETVLHTVCARFSTVLGPGSDGYHEDHIHLDLMERRNNYRICQWDVWDPLPKIAPLMPAARPEEAPPRATAAGEDEDESEPMREADKPDESKSAAKEPASQSTRAAKKRR